MLENLKKILINSNGVQYELNAANVYVWDMPTDGDTITQDVCNAIADALVLHIRNKNTNKFYVVARNFKIGNVRDIVCYDVVEGLYIVYTIQINIASLTVSVNSTLTEIPTSDATQTKHGLMSTDDKKKLDAAPNIYYWETFNNEGGTLTQDEYAAITGANIVVIQSEGILMQSNFTVEYGGVLSVSMSAFSTAVTVNAEISISISDLTYTVRAEVYNLPTHTSQLVNDSNFITTENAHSYTDTAMANLVDSAPDTLNTLNELATAITEHLEVTDALDAAITNKVDKVSGKGLSTNDYTTEEKNKLAGAYTKPSGGIPKTDLASDVQTSLGKADTALQSFTETDPTVPAWAKAASKPTYTAAEVGALPSTTTIPTKVSQLTNDSGFVLSSGLKTINGESIVGSGDITIESGSTGASVIETAFTTLDTIQPNVAYRVTTTATSLVINSFSEPLTDDTAAIYSVVFNTATSGVSLSVPESVKWANDTVPTIEGQRLYELNFLKTTHVDGHNIYLGVVTNFGEHLSSAPGSEK